MGTTSKKASKQAAAAEKAVAEMDKSTAEADAKLDAARKKVVKASAEQAAVKFAAHMDPGVAAARNALKDASLKVKQLRAQKVKLDPAYKQLEATSLAAVDDLAKREESMVTADKGVLRAKARLDDASDQESNIKVKRDVFKARAGKLKDKSSTATLKKDEAKLQMAKTKVGGIESRVSQLETVAKQLRKIRAGAKAKADQSTSSTVRARMKLRRVDAALAAAVADQAVATAKLIQAKKDADKKVLKNLLLKGPYGLRQADINNKVVNGLLSW